MSEITKCSRGIHLVWRLDFDSKGTAWHSFLVSRIILFLAMLQDNMINLLWSTEQVTLAWFISYFIIMLSKASALKPPLKMSETIYQIAYINLLHCLEKPEELRSSETASERLLCNLNSVFSCLSITLQTKVLILLLIYRIDPLKMNKQQVHGMLRS